ncbi:MAG TPA: M56 family metallopeptidase [Verrucomicrobiae bacterium]|nr:M56 family metallopeptidase [Verrucomicrobiae bacterium]
MNWVQPMVERVWEISLSATVLIALGWLVILFFGRRMPAWARYGIWVLVFLRLMMPMVPAAGFSVWSLGRGKAETLTHAASTAFSRRADYQPAVQQSPTLRYKKRPLLWVIGAVTWVAVAVVQHRRAVRWVRGQRTCDDQRVMSALDRARAAFNVRKQVAILINDRFEAPAVFGWRRPTLLLPKAWLKDAGDDELYGVMLHEMAHVKSQDALLNWLWILVRSVHWFNPFVWYAFRRLRAERELFCDGLVLKRLQVRERAVYGSMLLRMAAQLSGATAPPTLVPILQHKPEIHRRIHMIAKYKSTPWLLSAAFILLLIVLASITFTRAAEKKAPPGIAAAPERAKSIDVLELEFAKQQEIVRKLRAESSAFGERLGGTDRFGTDTLDKLRGQRFEAQTELTRLSSLLNYLVKETRANLRQSINTASPDAQLTELFQQLNSAEQKMAELLDTVAPAHPDVQRITRVVAQINKQIDQRIDGIILGLQARVAAEEAHLKALDQAFDEATARYRARLQIERPYQEATRELQAQEEILQRLRVRMLDERINNALEGAKQK